MRCAKYLVMCRLLHATNHKILELHYDSIVWEGTQLLLFFAAITKMLNAQYCF